MTKPNTGGMFRSFSEKNVRIYMGGIAVSNLGTWAQVTAAILLVRDLGGGGLELGIVTALQYLPLLFLGLYAGAVADRVDRHKLTMALQTLMGVQAVILGIVDLTGNANIPIIYGLTFVLGMLTAFDQPARRTMSTELVSPENLANVMSLSTSVLIGARIFGPALAAVLAESIGTGWVFLGNGVTFLLFVGAMATMDTSRFYRITPAKRSKTPVRDGLRAVWNEPVLRVSLVVLAVISTFAYNHLVYYPLVVEDLLKRDASYFGWLLSTMSIGNVLGALIVARLVVVQQWWAYMAGTIIALMLIGISVSTVAPLTFAFAGILGVGTTLFVNSLNMIFQQRTDPQMRSRILALISVIFLGSTPIGGPITGALGDAFGARWAVLYGGIITAVTVLAGLAALARMDREHLRETAVGSP